MTEKTRGRGPWQEKLPALLAENERFAREFARQQGDLTALRLRCAEAARLVRLGEYLAQALEAARESLEEGKVANALSGMSFLMADKKYQRLERLRAMGRTLQQQAAPFCERMEELGLSAGLDLSAEVEGLDDDSGRMMAVLGISSGHMSPEDEVNKIRKSWQGSAVRLEALLAQLRDFHAERLALLERKQAAFEKLLQNAGGERDG